MKAIYLTTVLLTLLSVLPLSAQDLSMFKEGVSPQVALMNRYGSYPVDLSTGLVDISVPLYTLPLTQLDVPLDLKFHASGLRADEREGLLGVRWALTGMGHVSRVIKGYPDEYMHPFNTEVNQPDYDPDVYTLFGTTSTLYKSGGRGNAAFTSDGGSYLDTEYDVFSFCLPNGKSGKFILQEDGTPFIMPYEPYQIFWSTDHATFTIVDDTGTRYEFGGGKIDINDDDYITSWLLNSVTSADREEKVTYDYEYASTNRYVSYASLVISDNLYRNIGGYYCYEDMNGITYISPLYIQLGDLFCDQSKYFDYEVKSYLPSGLQPSGISFYRNGALLGSVEFAFVPDADYLRNLYVKDGNGNTVRTFTFTLSSNEKNRLKFLERIEVGTGTDKEVYSFEYYGTPTTLTYSDIRSKPDWWGYYSSLYGSYLYGENASVTYRVLSGQDSNPRTTSIAIEGKTKQADGSSQLGMLSAIYYPTGGYTTFEYEPNEVNGRLYGGLRILRMESTVSVSDPGIQYKYFEYEGEVPEHLWANGTNLFTENEMECYVTADCSGVTDNYGEGNFFVRTYENGIPARYMEFRSNTVYYSQVTEYDGYDASAANAKTVYEYDQLLPEFSYYDATDGYEFEGHPSGYGYKRGYVSPTDFWAGNRLVSKKVYAQGRLVKENQYEYQIHYKDSLYDLPVFQYRNYLTGYDESTYNSYLEWNVIKNQTPLDLIFAFKRQLYTSGAEKLSKEMETLYHEDGTSTSTVKEYTYDPKYLFLSTETVTGSDDVKKKTTYWHLGTYGSVEDSANKNILSPVTRKTIEANDTWELTSVSYDKWYSYSFYPSDVSWGMQYSNGRSLTQYHNYLPGGRPLYFIENGTDDIVCLWSYNHLYPVAFFRNATYSEVVSALESLGYDETFIESLADTTVPTEEELAALEDLRSLLPDALVTTATYQPLVGKLSETDPSGRTTYYSYDALGRLKETYIITDGSKEILEAYTYTLANNE